MEPLSDLLGESPEIGAIRDKIVRLLAHQQDARRLPPVIIEGETGTGKGLLARVIHRAGPRPQGPFVDVNCAAIPETLLEAEMFGFERGAFTDARRAKPGLLQAANRGTIFLDEVALLSEGLQAKLLKVLEERSVRRLGSTRDEPIDVWILTATNENLKAAIAARRFREDLYHRLAVLTLSLPPLRTRGGDILLLAEHYLGRACADYGVSAKALSADARAALRAYPWPGNVRELANLMERVALLSPDPEVTAGTLGLPTAAMAAPSTPASSSMASSLDDAVRDRVVEVLRQTGWNISRTASLLGISRNTLRARIEKYGLRSQDAAPSAPAPRKTRMVNDRPTTIPAAPVPASLHWERRRVTLLRAALITPPALETPLTTSRSLESLLDKIRSFGGSVEGRGPRGVIAVFGLDPIEDAPSRAAHAAMAIQNAIARVRQESGAGPAVKVAIHVSQFLVGQDEGGVELDLETKQAAFAVLDSLIERAVPDSVVVSDAIAAFLERGFELLELGSAEPGRRPVFALVGRERSGVGGGRRSATFVGRHRELELLSSHFESAVRGHGQIVGVSGEAGIGKSRLLFEFRQRLASHDFTWLVGHCLSYASAAPYLPILDILRTVLGIAEGDAPEAIAEKVHRGIEGTGRQLVGAAPSVLQIMGIKEGAKDDASIDPDALKARIAGTLQQLCLHRSRGTPMIIAIEDVHWIDAASEEMLASLVNVVGAARILLLLTYRPGYRPSWMAKSYTTQMAVQPLAPLDSMSVVKSVLGAEKVADSLIELVLVKAEGNPFFLEELARAIREEGGHPSILPVPATVQEVLRARIGRLPRDEQRLLQSCAVVGKDVPIALLREISELPEGAVQRGLRHLEATEFLYENSLGPDAVYTFKHALTHEVAYESVLAEERRTHHARILTVLESLQSDRTWEQIERLAYHAFRGEVWAKALTYSRQAGVKALVGAAQREAATCFEQALVSLKHLPDGPQKTEESIDIKFDLRTALLPLGELGRILEYLREAEAEALALDDQKRVGQLSVYMAGHYYLMGDHARALEAGARALALADALGDFALAVAANAYQGQNFHVRGDYQQAAAAFRRNVRALVGDRVGDRFGLPQLPAVHSRTCLVWCLAELGEFAEGVTIGEEAIRIGEAIGHPLNRTVAYAGLGMLHLRRGDIERGLPILERALELSQSWNIRLWFPRVASTLGSAYALAGRLPQALALLAQAVERGASMGVVGGHALLVTSLGEGYALAGRMSEAMTAAQEALALARAHGERGYEAWSHRLLGEIALRGDPVRPDQARESLARALALAEELGMRPLAAFAHLGLTQAYRTADGLASARAHAAAAIASFRQLDMPFWVARGEAALARLA